MIATQTKKYLEICKKGTELKENYIIVISEHMVL